MSNLVRRKVNFLLTRSIKIGKNRTTQDRARGARMGSGSRMGLYRVISDPLTLFKIIGQGLAEECKTLVILSKGLFFSSLDLWPEKGGR